MDVDEELKLWKNDLIWLPAEIFVSICTYAAQSQANK